LTKSAFTLKAFGLYVLAAGVAFALMPATILALAGLPPAADVWPRIVGLMALVIGVYYQVAAHTEARAVIGASILIRGGFVVAIAALVGLSLAPPPMLLFGLIDLVGALWTYAALRSEAQLA
jgi:hypothetical protein